MSISALFIFFYNEAKDRYGGIHLKTVLLVILWSLLVIILAAALLFIFMWIVSLFVDDSKEYEKKSKFHWFLLLLASDITFWFARIRIHVTGKENLPKDGRYLIVTNHRSKFDPIITWSVLREQYPACISKKENFKVPIFGRIIRRCCFMAIDRENPRNAMTTINKAAKLIENDECSVAVWPEGTRSKNKQLLPFHNGVFKIAHKAKVPVVIVAIDGTENIVKNFPLHGTDVSFDILETIPADFVSTHKTSEIGDIVRERIIEHLPEATPINPEATTILHHQMVHEEDDTP